MRALLILFFTLFFTSVFSQQFFNEIKTDKSELPLLIKELSTKEILVAVNLSDTNANYNLYKLDALGHILNSASFIAIDSVWLLKAIHETSYGYLLCNQIRSRNNKRTVFLKLIGIDKNLNVLFNRNHLIVDSATLGHEVTTDIDELNGRFASLSIVHYESINIPYQLFFKTMQYDEYGYILKSTSYLPQSNMHGFFQYLKLKSDGTATALICLSETHQLFLDSNLKVTNDTVFKDANGIQPQLSLEADYARIISDSSLLYFNFIPDSSGFSAPCVSIFKRNGIALNKILYYSIDWYLTPTLLSNKNLAYNGKNIFTANDYSHNIPAYDDSKIIISKYDFQLNKIWEKEVYSSSYKVVKNVIVLSDGSCLILTQNAKDSTQSGTFIIKISDNGILQAVSNFSLQKNVVKVYPNPGNKFITLEGIETDNLNLIDVLGNSFSLKSTNNIFDTNDLPSGIYFYQLHDKNINQTFSGKWIKE